MDLMSITKGLIRGTVVVWLVWDVLMLAVVLLGGPRATISHVMWTWREEYPWFALAVMMSSGFLMWHFFVGWFDA